MHILEIPEVIVRGLSLENVSERINRAVQCFGKSLPAALKFDQTPGGLVELYGCPLYPLETNVEEATQVECWETLGKQCMLKFFTCGISLSGSGLAVCQGLVFADRVTTVTDRYSPAWITSGNFMES